MAKHISRLFKWDGEYIILKYKKAFTIADTLLALMLLSTGLVIYFDTIKVINNKTNESRKILIESRKNYTNAQIKK